MVQMATDEPFPLLLTACEDLAALFPDGIVFIGGIAIYLHAVNTPATEEFAEATHDGDFYISMADMSDLRNPTRTACGITRIASASWSPGRRKRLGRTHWRNRKP